MTPEVLSFFSDLIRVGPCINTHLAIIFYSLSSLQAQGVELQWDLLVLEGLKETDIQALVEYSQRTKAVKPLHYCIIQT